MARRNEQLVRYDRALLDERIDEEGFARLASAVGALEVSARGSSRDLTIGEARDALIQAQHDPVHIDQAIAQHLYRPPETMYSRYFDSISDLYVRTAMWAEHYMKNLAPFEFLSDKTSVKISDGFLSIHVADKVWIDAHDDMVSRLYSLRASRADWLSRRLNRSRPEKARHIVLSLKHENKTCRFNRNHPDQWAVILNSAINYTAFESFLAEEVAKGHHRALEIMAHINSIPSRIDGIVRDRNDKLARLVEGARNGR